MSKSNSGFLSGNGSQMKQLGHKIHNRDSSSESDRSHQEASTMSESTLNEQHTTSQSDNDDGHEKRGQDTIKPVLSLGKQEAAFFPKKLNYRPSFACIPCTAEPYYGGVLTGYSQHAIVHPQINGTTNSPVPSAVEPAAEEPIFVNAKQYHAILRRRQIRAKLEAQNKLVKDRKPYLHESRHRHAMKRARGSGGRFLNTKQLQEQKHQQQQQASGGSSSTQHHKKNICSQKGHARSTSTPVPPNVASVPRANQDHTCFPSAGFRPTMNFSGQGGGDAKLVVNGMQQRVSIMR